MPNIRLIFTKTERYEPGLFLQTKTTAELFSTHFVQKEELHFLRNFHIQLRWRYNVEHRE